MQCVSRRQPPSLELMLNHDYVLNSFSNAESQLSNAAAAAAAAGRMLTQKSLMRSFDWNARDAEDVKLTGGSAKTLSPSGIQQQMRAAAAAAAVAERSPESPPDVMGLPARLYYDSVQLNVSPSHHADDVAAVLRHDMAAMDGMGLKAKKLDVESAHDAEKMEIEEFLRVHCLRIAQGCRDVPVKELRHIIPILILHCFCMKGEQAQKKVKGLWERAPQGWPADVPYCDPNNAPLRSRTGEPIGTKPKKETLNLMFDFLIREYLRQNHNYAVSRILDAAATSDMSKYSAAAAAASIGGGGQSDSHVGSLWPRTNSNSPPMRISQAAAAASYWQQQQQQQQHAPPPHQLQTPASAICRLPPYPHPHPSQQASLSYPMPPFSSDALQQQTTAAVAAAASLKYSVAVAAAEQRMHARKRPYDSDESLLDNLAPMATKSSGHWSLPPSLPRDQLTSSSSSSSSLSATSVAAVQLQSPATRLIATAATTATNNSISSSGKNGSSVNSVSVAIAYKQQQRTSSSSFVDMSPPYSGGSASGRDDATSSRGSSKSSFSYSDHMPPLLDCRDDTVALAAPLSSASVIRKREAVADPAAALAPPSLCPPSPDAIDGAPQQKQSEPSPLAPHCLSPAVPVSSCQPPPSPPHPMTKKARLLAAVTCTESPPLSPASSSSSRSDTATPASEADSDKQQLQDSQQQQQPATTARPQQPVNDQALADVMQRIVDKIGALEARQESMDHFGIILIIKDLLWKMRPLLDGSQYLAYLEKLHELDCTLDAIGMLGRFPETHYNRWQEFEDKWYIRVCGHTNYDSTNAETATSFAHS